MLTSLSLTLAVGLFFQLGFLRHDGKLTARA